ncbi:MAG: hypothetical protein AUH46_07485 [Gemmatimonadetes bacterium 13_1_40CM_70_15]|nr:MAG: hypothetical protein AUH46_07485 [Gemmatimonadetes bacterium 13_1_40CM_70_15]
MPKPDPDRRLEAERRLLPDRQRRGGADRRQVGERRSAIERRLSLQSAVDQIHGALKLLTQVAESEATTLSEEQRRELEGAMLRLRFALERLEEG